MYLFQEIQTKYQAGQPIFLEDIGELDSAPKSSVSIRKQVERMTQSGLLMRVGRGVYTIKEKTELGFPKQVDVNDVIEKKFIADGNLVYGFYVGVTLLNIIGISYQKPNIKDIVTDKESSNRRMVDIMGRQVVVRKSRVDITASNASVLQFLEVIAEYDKYADIDKDKAKKLLINYFKKKGVTKSSILKYLQYFPAKVSKALLEGNIYDEFA